jgi:hypothetical protein
MLQQRFCIVAIPAVRDWLLLSRLVEAKQKPAPGRTRWSALVFQRKWCVL